MTERIVQSIINQRKVCYFISPHFDDAILSAGALLTYLSKYTKIVVINVFTKAGEKPYTFSAKTYLKQCGYTDAKKLYTDRESEDAIVFKKIVNKIFNLGFTDALWRRKYMQGFLSKMFGNLPEFQVIYPTYRFHVIRGIIADQDFKTLENIKIRLQKIIDTENGVIFCPFGIGNHIDHILARRACDELFNSNIYWSDFPYNTVSSELIHNLHSFSFEENREEKKKMIAGYVTQYAAMFKDGLSFQPERFFIKT